MTTTERALTPLAENKEKLSISLKLSQFKRKDSDAGQQPLKKIKLNMEQPMDTLSICQRLYSTLMQAKDGYVYLKKRSIPKREREMAVPLLSSKTTFIQTKLDENAYKSVRPFVNDVNQVFDTIKAEYMPESQQLQDALKIHALFIKQLDKEVTPFQEEDVKALFSYIESAQVKQADRLLRKFPMLVDHLAPSTLFDSVYTWNPLHAACYYGHERIVRVCMDLGADIEAQDTLNKARPLGWAAYGGHASLCRTLIEQYKADVWATNMHGQVAYTLVADPTHSRWAGIWVNRPDQENQSNADSQESFRVKVVTSEPSRKSAGRVLLKVPTLGKRGEEEDEDDFVKEIEANYVPSKPRRSTGATIRRPFSAAIPVQQGLSYGNFNLEPSTLIKSLGIVSNDEFVRSVLEVDPLSYGTVVTVPPATHSLALRLNLESLPEHTLFASGLYYAPQLDLLKFKMDSTGHTQDTHLFLRDGVNIFEIRIVGGIVNQKEVGKRPFLEFEPGTEKGQSFLLVVNR